MKFQNLQLSNKVLLAALAPLSLLFVLVAITVITVNTLLESSRWVDHTHNVLDKTLELVSSALDMETGMRGYLLTGEENFLEPYQDGMQKTFKLIEGLKETVSDNPPQVERMERIGSILERWNRNIAQENIELRRSIGAAASVEDLSVRLSRGEGKQYFDTFRSHIDAFIEKEVEILTQRHGEFTSTMNNAQGNFENLRTGLDFVTHTRDVMDHAEKLLSEALNMETGIRGYMLTGQESFLAPYFAGQKTFRKTVSNMKILLEEQPEQLKRVEVANQFIKNWDKMFGQPGLELRTRVNQGKATFDEIEAFSDLAKGKKQFDDFRSTVDDILVTEMSLLKKREEITQFAEKSYRKNNVTLIGNEQLLASANNVIRKALHLQNAAINMETGMRGYLLTGIESFLDPLNIGSGRFNAFAEELAALVHDDPQQLDILTQAKATLKQWLNHTAEPLIKLRRKIANADTMEDLAARIGTGQGKEFFDEFRKNVADFKNAEIHLLELRNTEKKADIDKAYLSIAVTLISALGIGSLFAMYIGRSISRPVKDLTRDMKRLADGNTEIHISARNRLDELGDMATTIAVFRDNLIENQRLQEAMGIAQSELKQKSAELERSNQELENFAYIASHDLKAPLRGISNLSKWIREDLGDSVDEETQENLELMHSRVERLENLLDGILQYSRVGRGDHKTESVNTDKLAHEIVEYLSPPDGCTVEISDGMPVMETELVPFEQVLRNLIGNAIKHRDRDNLRVTVKGKDEGDYCTFEVRDDGPGIPEQFHERVFMMFQTLKPRDEMEASGMGLAMVKKLIDYNGGDILLQSNPDEREMVFRFKWLKTQA